MGPNNPVQTPNPIQPGPVNLNPPASNPNQKRPWIAIIIIIILLLIGAGYLLFGRSGTSIIKKQPPLTITSDGSAVQPEENLEGDLNSINTDIIGSDGDFASIDQDLKEL